MTFDGNTYDAELDEARLETQLGRVYCAMVTDADEWWTLDRLAVVARGTTASVSARLRDLRKPRFGGHTVERRRVLEADRGLFQYRLISSPLGLLDGREVEVTPGQCSCGEPDPLVHHRTDGPCYAIEHVPQCGHEQVISDLLEALRLCSDWAGLPAEAERLVLAHAPEGWAS